MPATTWNQRTSRLSHSLTVASIRNGLLLVQRLGCFGGLELSIELALLGRDRSQISLPSTEGSLSNLDLVLSRREGIGSHWRAANKLAVHVDLRTRGFRRD